MYCFIYYTDILKTEPEIDQSFQSITSLQTLQSVNSVILENKQLMVNPNCPMQIILDYICSEIGIDKNADYDLCDTETGDILDIKLLKPWSYPTNILQARHSYVIVFYEKDQYGQYRKIEPLISRQSKQYSEILLRIKRKIGSIRRTSSGLKKSKRGSLSSRASSSVDTSSLYKELGTKKSSLISKSKKNVSSQI